MIAFIQHRSLIIAVVLHPKSIVCLCVVSQKTAVEFVTTCSSLNPRLNLSSTQTFFAFRPPLECSHRHWESNTWLCSRRQNSIATETLWRVEKFQCVQRKLLSIWIWETLPHPFYSPTDMYRHSQYQMNMLAEQASLAVRMPLLPVYCCPFPWVLTAVAVVTTVR